MRIEPTFVFAEDMRAAAMAGLRRRLGREPTDADVEAEKTEERRRHPLTVEFFPPAVHVEV